MAASRIRGSYAKWPNSRNAMRGVCIVLLLLFLDGCHRSSVDEPIAVTYFRGSVEPLAGFNLAQGYTASGGQGDQRERGLQEFTRETGIQVKLLPSPETNPEQLGLWRKLLATGASGADVYDIDVIWPGILSDDFIDLKPYFGNEIPNNFPALAANYTVEEKLVAVPYWASMGLLYYRTDLLRQYGYSGPPKTWGELEKMAARIQAGERAKGNKQFWGYVWQGANTEALTCNALEWQASEGGGQIIEQDKTISVNNPQAIRAWQRAARWVGSISPPSVLAYMEWDALNLWVAGDAAFMRHWPLAYVSSEAPGSPIRDKFEVTQLPGGKAGRVGTLGGAGLAVSRFSAHPREAIALVRYLLRRDVEAQRSEVPSYPPSRPDAYELLEVKKFNHYYSVLSQALERCVVSRPSNVAGTKYEDVSAAYRQAVHSVLTGKKSAPEAAAALEKELVRITGFKTGPPAQGVRGQQ